VLANFYKCLFVKFEWQSVIRDGFLGAALLAGSAAGLATLVTHGQTVMRGLATA
jgi:hypothetical protein